MSVTVAVPGRPESVTFHNGFAWFLDATLELLDDDAIPRHLFSQGAGPNVDGDPGDLDPEQSRAFALVLDSVDDERLDALMWNAMNGRPAEASMAPAIATLREVVSMARLGLGLSIR